ncbi:pilus assembly protein [Novosphingobium sp. FSY-8]|uniref:Pilus assembly protein n=1 Tax=Novosphingobium ovatum TaxID=1908523 RepID=A0ABW9XEJ7_9SPHN|nr:TadE/TadG family type IV pilus assembly protein [Novosphingobium ovatum]NBC36945.1 pilus assembly protein [Novosphingobium ovatum]
MRALRPLAAVWRRLWADQTGSIVVEFAFAAPIMISLYTMTYVLSDGFAASRKVTVTAHVITDLVSRNASVTPSQLTTMMAASTQVMLPYNATGVTIRISQLLVATGNSATVVWSQAQNGTARTVGSSVAMPSAMASVGTYVIYGEVTYPYTSALYRSRTLNMTETVLISPRLSSSIPLNAN